MSEGKQGTEMEWLWSLNRNVITEYDIPVKYIIQLNIKSHAKVGFR